MAKEKTTEKPTKKNAPKTKVNVDKWKRKINVRIIADKNFDNKELGETMATKPENIIGRKIKVNMADLTGQRQKRHVKIIFAIKSIEGNLAKTQAMGFDTSHGYLSRIVRKRNSKISTILIDKTKDKKTVKTTLTAVAGVKVPESTEKEIRKTLTTDLKEEMNKKDFDLFLQELLFGGFVSRLFKKINKVAPIKRIEIEKVLVLKE